jgi:cytoskeletal protein RodZ
MGSFGENLRREREARGITLDDISKATKISVRLLQAIEEEDFERLPGGVFNVNFVRQYARQIGLDEDRVVGDFRALTGEPSQPAPEAAPAPVEYDWERGRTGRWRTRTTVVLAIVCLAAVLYLARRSRQPPPSVPAAAAPPVVKSEPPPQPKVEPPPPAPEPAPPESLAPVRVELLATEEVWVSASADGKIVFLGTLQPEQRRTATAQERVRLRVGNAGALKVVLNGEEQPPLGPVGQVRTVVLTPEGMQVVAPPEKAAEPAETPTEPPRSAPPC